MNAKEIKKYAEINYERFEASGITAARAIAELEVKVVQLRDELEAARRLRNNISMFKADLDLPFNRDVHTHGLQNL